MRRPPVIVCECSTVWADALRRAFRRAALPPPDVVETRSPDQLRERLAEHRLAGELPPVPVVELTPTNGVAVSDFVRLHVDRGDDVPPVIVTSPELATYEAVLREAGANLLVSSPRAIDEVVRWYERYERDAARRLPAYVDDDATIDPLQDRLPWKTA